MQEYPDFQRIITNHNLALGVFDLSLLVEYLGSYGQIGKTLDMLPLWVAVVNTMVWSRIFSLDGWGQRSTGVSTEFPDLIYETEDMVTSSVPTLLPIWLLFLVLGVQPLLMVLASFGTRLLFKTLVSRNFGTMALLAGVDLETSRLLKGAAFSGQLKEEIKVRIVVKKGEDIEDMDEVKYLLGVPGKNSQLKRGTFYG
jgi:hypothetical protein